MTGKKILVALSGGVDSSVAALLLKEQGHRVEGATMVFRGVLKEDVDSARRVCRTLGIKHRVFDFRRPYRRLIVDDFIAEYRRGRTPNPCVRCNKLFKFGYLLQKAAALDFAAVATGHYAEVVGKNRRYLLRRGVDRNEQSYFLYRLGPEELPRIILPLGRLTKNEVRRMAAGAGLATARRAKSQDVCFLPRGDYAAFLKKILDPPAGPIFDAGGRRVGEHKGIVFYTYGQRRRLGISRRRPYYVTGIDAATNALFVGDKEDVYRRALLLADVTYISGKKASGRFRVSAKARYYAAPAAATVETTAGGARVVFDEPQWALTPGQSVVFYRGRTVLGGGIIDRVVG